MTDKADKKIEKSILITDEIPTDIVNKLLKDEAFKRRYQIIDLSQKGYYDSTIISANKKGTHSTVIPKPILKKLKLEKGQVLNWDIKGNDIVITPMGNDIILADDFAIEIFRKMLNNGHGHYVSEYKLILDTLQDEDKDNESKLNFLKLHYQRAFEVNNQRVAFTDMVNYLLLSEIPKNHRKILTDLNEFIKSQ